MGKKSSSNFWQMRWDDFPAVDQRDMIEMMREIGRWAGFKVEVRPHYGKGPLAPDPESDLTFGGLCNLIERKISVFTHFYTKKNIETSFKLVQVFSAFFHEMGHVRGLELGFPYELNHAAEKLPEKTLRESIASTIVGEVLAEIRAEHLAKHLLPDLKYKSSYSPKVFSLIFQSEGMEDSVHGPDVKWEDVYVDLLRSE